MPKTKTNARDTKRQTNNSRGAWPVGSCLSKRQQLPNNSRLSKRKRLANNSPLSKRQRLANNSPLSKPSNSTTTTKKDDEKHQKLLLRQMDAASIDKVSMTFQTSRTLAPYDALMWSELMLKHFGAPLLPALRSLSVPARDRGWNWTNIKHSCQQFRDFLRTYDEREMFDKSVRVVRGDLRTFREVDGTPIDGIIFPTNAHLTNPHNGAAGAVFERAGTELSEFVKQPQFAYAHSVESVVTTPGFNAGVEKLIHCVGPSFSSDYCYPQLEATYRNAMSAVMREGLQCVALTSISTGNQGVPAKGAAQVGLRAIQTFLRLNSGWRGTIAIVCVDATVYDAFIQAKQDILYKFNVHPLYPSRAFSGFGTVSTNPSPFGAGFTFGQSVPQSGFGSGFGTSSSTFSSSTPFAFGNPGPSPLASWRFGVTTVTPSQSTFNSRPAFAARSFCRANAPGIPSSSRWFRGLNGTLRPKK